MNFNVISPESNEELLTTIADNQGKHFRIGAGYTDLLLELKKQPPDGLMVINLAKLDDPDFTAISYADNLLSLGSMVTANMIVRDKHIHRDYPVLYQAALSHGSKQIRQTATVGGNLCTASPAGDMATALVAIRAQCEILSADGSSRIVPIDEFFCGVRKTCLKKDEILRKIIIDPQQTAPAGKSGFIKVGVRRSMECAVLSLAYHLEKDDTNVITRAGIAIGSMAPTIKFCQNAAEFLIGQNLSDIDSNLAGAFADKVLEYASPISDIRASAWYRKQTLHNISKTIFSNEAC